MYTRRADTHDERAGTLADEMERHLWHHTIDMWFPRCVDARGGYHPTFGPAWEHEAEAKARSVVFQARMLWVAATAAAEAPTGRPELLTWAEHGYDALARTFIDGRVGAIFTADQPNRSHSYGVAFTIKALAAFARTTGRQDAIELSHRVFEKWEHWAFDGQPGGCVEVLAVDGAQPPDDSIRDEIGTGPGLRSPNVLLHVVSALTELADVGRDPQVEHRLREAVGLLEGLVERGGGRLYTTYRPDATPVDRTRSPGHDLETVVFVMAAREVLGLDPTTTAEVLAERVLDEALDHRHGGVYSHLERGRVDRWRTEKIWWVQVESLAAFALLAAHGGSRTDDYLSAVRSTWGFIREHQIDRVHGGWFARVDRGGSRVVSAAKGTEWKAAYHETSALLRASRAIREVAAASGGTLGTT